MQKVKRLTCQDCVHYRQMQGETEDEGRCASYGSIWGGHFVGGKEAACSRWCRRIERGGGERE